jgi:2-oxoglutarate ferredoxin oxidoreductase subunit alpha
MDRLAHKFETIRQRVPKPIIDTQPSAEVGIIGYGTSHYAITEARDRLREQHGLPTSYLRLRAYPFTDEVSDFIRRYQRVYVVEQNRDGQMFDLLKLDLNAGFVCVKLDPECLMLDACSNEDEQGTKIF